MYVMTVQYTGVLYIEPPKTLQVEPDGRFLQLLMLPDDGVVRP